MGAKNKTNREPIIEPKAANKALASGFCTTDIFDLENLRSVVNIVPPVLREAMLNPELPRHWLDMAEYDLMQRVEKELDARDYRLRLNFWDEYNRSQANNVGMKVENIVRGAASNGYLYNQVLKNYHKLIFILTPPAAYDVSMKELLQLGTNRMREIMCLPLLNSKRQPNVPLAKLQHQIWESVNNRVQGAVTQRIEQKSLNVNLGKEHYTEKDVLKQKKMIDEEIRELQEELAEHPAGVIEVIADEERD